ncbi:hypothetical protein Q1695_012868 [Nippostrongylus brasiliensis]|nr:hypothetical protein Q1695_012868 [Nippostrongylus brasiliensis]
MCDEVVEEKLVLLISLNYSPVLDSMPREGRPDRSGPAAAPSAPPDSDGFVQRTIDQTTPSAPDYNGFVQRTIEQSDGFSSESHFRPEHQNGHEYQESPPANILVQQADSPYSMPPPSYQTVMSTSGTYTTSTTPYSGRPHGKPLPSRPFRQQQIPVYNTFHSADEPPPAPVVYAVRYGRVCPSCNVGVMTKDIDACCLVCLILLALITFPIGLVFICCIPCAINYRCTHCGNQWLT